MTRTILTTLLALLVCTAASAAKPTHGLGRARRLVGDAHLASVRRTMHRLVRRIDAWVYRGKPDVVSEGSLSVRLLDKTVKATARLGRRLAASTLLRSYQVASPAARAAFDRDLEHVRGKLARLHHVHYVGCQLDRLFDAPSSVAHKAGLAGINEFLRATAKGRIVAGTREVGQVEALFGLLTAPLSRLDVDDVRPQPLASRPQHR